VGFVLDRTVYSSHDNVYYEVINNLKRSVVEYLTCFFNPYHTGEWGGCGGGLDRFGFLGLCWKYLDGLSDVTFEVSRSISMAVRWILRSVRDDFLGLP
jgi:hypothetical protein